MMIDSIVLGNCLDVMQSMPDGSVDLVYFDPPFFTQKTHRAYSKNDEKRIEFDDKFDSLAEYLGLIESVLLESKRILRSTGSVFLHCDRTASHHLRLLLDKVMEERNFQSEIIWSYKRWSNSKKGLLNSHQVIFLFKNA